MNNNILFNWSNKNTYDNNIFQIYTLYFVKKNLLYTTYIQKHCVVPSRVTFRYDLLRHSCFMIFLILYTQNNITIPSNHLLETLVVASRSLEVRWRYTKSTFMETMGYFSLKEDGAVLSRAVGEVRPLPSRYWVDACRFNNFKCLDNALQ